LFSEINLRLDTSEKIGEKKNTEDFQPCIPTVYKAYYLLLGVLESQGAVKGRCKEIRKMKYFKKGI
jgi:hypothetical protein